ncbi:hypothetical protein JB92DRAFT_2832284 [Gautieria morchelliformis]|nr:hypothetical protein JB92DRAFT_2832284 [Gautieria morchelliformis]
MQTQYFDLEGVRPSGRSQMLTIAQKPEKIFPVYIHERQSAIANCIGDGAAKGMGCDERERSPGADEDGHRIVEGRAVQFAESRIGHYELFPNLQNYHSRVFKSIALPENGGVRKTEVYTVSGMSTIQINLKLLMRSKHSRNYNYQAEASSISAHVRGRGQRIEGIYSWPEASVHTSWLECQARLIIATRLDRSELGQRLTAP